MESDFALPHKGSNCSPRAISESDKITLRRGSLAHISCTMRKIRPRLIYDVGDGFLLEPRTVRGMLAMHIDFQGRALTVDCPDDLLEVAAAWAIHAGLGAATLTHGGLPLHGAGLEVAGRYVALMADSGSGKSTLSWFLMQQGARFGNDDLIPVRWEGEAAVAFPSVSLAPKLSREAVDRHGLEASALQAADYGMGEEEYYAPMPPKCRILLPAPLVAVFFLRPLPLSADGLITVRRMDEAVAAERLPEGEAAAALRQNLHAAWLIEKWMDGRKLDALCHRLAAHVPVYYLVYPKAFAVLPALAETVRQIACNLPVEKL